MQIAQTGTPENVELHGKLNLGGRWYFRGDTVQVSPEDAAALRMRGLAVSAKRGAVAKNLPVAPKAPETPDAETVAALEVGTVTREEKGVRNGGSAGKRR